MATDSSTGDPSLWSFVGPAIQAGAGIYGANAAAGRASGGFNTAAGTAQVGLNTSGAALQPFQQGGQESLSALENLYGFGGQKPNFDAFEKSPGFLFSEQQGDQAINRAAAASGGAYSSTTLAALGKYNNGLAQTQYQQYLQGLYGLTQTGASAATARGSQALTGAGLVGSNQSQAGLQTASGIAGAAGAVGNIAGKLPWQQIGNAISGSGTGPSGWNPSLTQGDATGAGTDLGNGVDVSSMFGPSPDQSGVTTNFEDPSSNP